MANEFEQRVQQFYEAAGDDVDVTTFSQILEMDENETNREFSAEIFTGFIQQAESTFEEMNEALEERDLLKLSSLGHYLKGSSATLGFTKIRDECEKIQNYGNGKDATGENDEPDEDECLTRIGVCVSAATEAFSRVRLVTEAMFDDLVELRDRT